MILEHKGKRPVIDRSARIAPNATICGEVLIGANISIGFGAVVSAESGAVHIGTNCVVMDTAVLRGVRGSPLTIGDSVLVGPRATRGPPGGAGAPRCASTASYTCVRRCQQAPRSHSAGSPSETQPRSCPRMNTSGFGQFALGHVLRRPQRRREGSVRK
jgi:acetyltransferase-like isoleucine patch superfamily enzyme